MLTENQSDVYKKIFEITDANLKAGGSDAFLSKGAFMAVVGSNPREADISRIEKLPPKDYLQALFHLTFKRMPDDHLLKSLSEEDYAKPDFKRTMLQRIQFSPEFGNNPTSIINNVFQNNSGLPMVDVYFAGYPVLNKVYGAYRKLPKGFRKNVRRMLGRKE